MNNRRDEAIVDVGIHPRAPLKQGGLTALSVYVRWVVGYHDHRIYTYIYVYNLLRIHFGSSH